MYKTFQDLRIHDAVYEWNHATMRYDSLTTFKREFLVYKWRVKGISETVHTKSVSLICPYDGVEKTLTVYKSEKDICLSNIYFSDLNCLIEELIKGLNLVKRYLVNRFKTKGFYHLLNRDADDIRTMKCILQKLHYRMTNANTKADHLFRPYADGTTLMISLVDLRRK